MSSNENNKSDVLADAIRFAPGATYGCKADYYKDMRSQRYKDEPAFARRCDQKLAYTLQQCGGVVEGAREIHSSDYRSAGAVRRPDGSIDAGLTSLDKPNGTPADQQEEDQQPPAQRTIINGLPILIEKIPGGGVRVKAAPRPVEEIKPLVKK